MNVEEYSALNLAYLGDAVFELLIRDQVFRKGNKQVNKMHKESKQYVNATSQAKMYMAIFELLSEEEQQVLKRGRNAKSFRSAKNSSLTEYRQATGLEALFGYLYFKGDQSRLQEVFDLCMKAVEISDISTWN